MSSYHLGEMGFDSIDTNGQADLFDEVKFSFHGGIQV